MKVRTFLILKSISYLAFAIMAVVLMLTNNENDNDRLVMGVIIILLLLYLSVNNFKKARSVDENQNINGIPSNASNDEKIKGHKQLMYTALVLFPLLSIFFWWQLNKVANGESVDTFFLIALLYYKLGYWAAVLCMPILTIIVVGTNYYKIQKLKSESKKTDRY